MRNLIGAILFGLLLACENSGPVMEASTDDASVASDRMGLTPYPKPGAAVVFAAEFGGPLQVGEMAPLVVQLQAQYPSGTFKVSIRGLNGLKVEGDTEFSTQFDSPYQYSREFLVGADQPGDYFLSVMVTIITPSGVEESRAFAEPISVGKVATLGAATKLLENERPAETHLPAEEQILTP